MMNWSIFCKSLRMLLLLSLLVAVGLMLSPRAAQAGLTILPTRVVFEGRDRFAEVTLINTDKEEKTYEIGWQYFNMESGTGTYLKAEPSTLPLDLADVIVYTPRRVTLQPDEKQKIRLALRPKGNIPPGEYRAHLRFKSVKGQEIPSSMNDESLPDGKMQAAVMINIGYSIPVIYTVGESDADATIRDLSMSRNEKSGLLQTYITVDRTGGLYGAHGFLEVYHAAGGGEGRLVGELSNAHIFAEADHRTFKVFLREKELAPGNLRVVYRHFDKDRNLVYDERSFPIQ